MTSKDKPKRGEGKTFIREIKPKSDASSKAGAPKSSSKPGAAAKRGPAKAAAFGKPERSFKAESGAKRERSFKQDGDFKPREAKPRAFKTDGERADKPARSVAPSATSTEADDKAERISKILARSGVASRRDIERMIMEGRVSLNGKVLDTPVINVTLADKIEVDGMPIRGIERTRLWLYHKPSGLVTTNSDPEGRSTVFENLPEGLPRVMSVGRLDINTEGLLLLTNDGGLSRVLELPTTGWLRRYRVRAHGEIDQEALDKLKDGIAVEGVLYGAIEATLDRSQGRNVWITMGLREGKNREIKNVLGALGLEVNRLIRISYGPFQLGDLPEGEVIEVRGRTLREQLGPRLIEDSKANFEAPIYNEMPAPEEKPARTEKPAWGERPERNERSDAKRDTAREVRRDDRREDRGGERRERTPGRVDNKFGSRGDFAAKPRGKSDDRGFGEEKPKKRPPMGTSRTANVWMAPGARPTLETNVKKSSARAEAERLFDKPVPVNDRPVVVKRAEDDADWIRADSPPQKEGDFGGKRSFGDRPGRSDRSSDEPRRERSFGDKPRGDRKPRDAGDRPRSFDKPRGERSFGDKPRTDRKPREDGERPARSYSAGDARSDRPHSDRSRGERSFGDRPQRSERPSGERPTGDRPFGGKPAGKSFGAKPGAKPFGGKPGGGKSFGGKPSGGRGGSGQPSGGKPGGRPAPRSGGKPRTPRG
ncbi:pseudouridine synthase [Neorhizobium lilium]|uniref:Pseudouridine synthase n=1 Tax=Neorhizobium lilium TaxID=2503024 RepID=A0A444LG34_9HYPH|nr:pseudouridine synthase [Neorhizobium lilium]RWX77129.1 pseudouridine synthase [Neorhizobium lilium]